MSDSNDLGLALAGLTESIDDDFDLGLDDLELPETPSTELLEIDDPDSFSFAGQAKLEYPCFIIDGDADLTVYKVGVLQAMVSVVVPGAPIKLYTKSGDSTYLLGGLTGKQARSIVEMLDPAEYKVFLEADRELVGPLVYALAN